MSHHRFERTWRIAADPGVVFDALLDTPTWPRWWPALLDVETVDGDPQDPMDRLQRFTTRAPVGYRLELYGRLLRAVRPERLVARIEGDLEGGGRMELTPVEDGTLIAYVLSVDIRKPWMARLDPLLGPVFAWSHDRVVDQGMDGLEQRISTR